MSPWSRLLRRNIKKEELTRKRLQKNTFKISFYTWPLMERQLTDRHFRPEHKYRVVLTFRKTTQFVILINTRRLM